MWKKLGLDYFNKWQKTKWIIATIIFFIPNIVFFYICRLGEAVENYYFGNFMPTIMRWIKK